MRVRRLATLFWALCMVVCFITIYYLTEKLLTPPKGLIQDDIKDNSWIHFEDKLKRLESEVHEYHAVVGELKSAVHDLMPMKRSVEPEHALKNIDEKIKLINRISSNLLHDNDIHSPKCMNKMNVEPNADIQMLDVYEHLKFDNPDGGVWKQGYRIEYNPEQWNSHHKLKVFIVPHSHNDPGWLKTFEEYYNYQTRAILNNIVLKLSEDTRRKFVWAEISFLSLWWNEATKEQRRQMKKLIQSKQLEIVTGGWVMNDEANSHWISVIQQLTTGHQWLKQNLDLVPKSSWSIDPFGHSATQPYLLKLTGINGSLIQRVHYSVKKEFSIKKYLEFRWRQAWDTQGQTDLFTHMMPFYSYDIPHSCGPDPKICCQFDFKRLPGYGVTCPWKISPQVINERNVNHKAELILEQWRKKAQLYKTRVVLMPLGDDFRWDHVSEWDAQFNNYGKIMDYLNSNSNLHVEVQFGTLTDFLNAVMMEKSSHDFPVLSGDFFTYADRDDHYWSGYYTSRPFYKRMDRILMSYLRAAEIILTLAKARTDIPNIVIGPESGLSHMLENSRQSLALFQHHDGVTGTSRDPVVIDYGKKLLNGINDCQHVIQQAAYHLLVQKDYFHPSTEHAYFEVDDLLKLDSPSEKITITIGEEVPSKKIVLFNSLTFSRTEVVSFQISTPYVVVTNSDDIMIDCQITPIISSGTRIQEYQYLLSFVAKVPAFGLSSYIVTAVKQTALSEKTNFAKVSFLNYDGDAPSSAVFLTKIISTHSGGDFTLKLNDNDDGLVAGFSQIGLLKSIKTTKGKTVPIHLDFVKYNTRSSGDKSGGYLFLPGTDQPLFNKHNNYPLITITQGPIISKMIVHFPLIKHCVNIYFTSDYFIEVINHIDIAPSRNTEVVMRLNTGIKNNNVFYTDLNGFQVIRRKYFEKIPTQANFYPMPSAAYIEDDEMRLTLVTSTSLGVAALTSGQLEVMLDRRLEQDDNRGLNQGITDNRPTRHIFRILLESNNNFKCERPIHNHPTGHLSLAAHVSSESLIYPIINLFYSGDGHPESSITSHSKNLLDGYASTSEEPGIDIIVASYRDEVLSTLPNKKTIKGRGLVLYRNYFNLCYMTDDQRRKFPLSDGKVKLGAIVPLDEVDEVRNSSLTFVRSDSKVEHADSQSLCPMELHAYFIHR